MAEKKCCIIPESLRRSNTRLANAFSDSKLYQCQFLGASEDTHEFNGNYYCILHLPYEIKKERKLNTLAIEQFQEYVKKGETNFNFVCLEGLDVSLNSNKCYSFIGAWIWTIHIHDSLIECLDIRYSKIQGLNQISNSEIQRFYIKYCEIGSHFELNKNKIKLMLAEHNYFNFDKKQIRLDVVNYGFIIYKGAYSAIRLKYNKFDIALQIAKSKIKILELIDNVFFVCPIFFKGDFGGISELVLPEIKDYNFSKMPPKKQNNFWENQYRKFREIYNIAKMREMYIEQSCYFTLMQHCIQKISKTPKFLKWVSYLYGLISDYGQSVSRPLWWIAGLFLASALFFWALGVKPDYAAYLSLTQIKPYSILFEDEPRKLISNLCETRNQQNFIVDNPFIFFQNQQSNQQDCSSLIQYKNGGILAIWSVLSSTFYIILLTCVGLALRWNFRKA